MQTVKNFNDTVALPFNSEIELKNYVAYGCGTVMDGSYFDNPCWKILYVFDL